MHEIIKYVSLNIIKHKKISCGSNSIISSFENQDLTLRQIRKLNRMSLHYRELHGPKKNLLGAKGHWEVNDAIQVQFKLFFTICGLHVIVVTTIAEKKWPHPPPSGAILDGLSFQA